MKIGLKAGERLFINGAVIRAERKTSIELLNDAVFLLEAHVLQPEDATTPLKQLYFILQTMIIDPAATNAARDMFCVVLDSVKSAFSNQEILDRLDDVSDLVKNERLFEAMKIVRALYPIEARLMAADIRERQEVNRARAQADRFPANSSYEFHAAANAV
ncbi:flagellar biosynthesis repressor FlbT [Roseibium denhamense]|uniref:Flagellar protein FlbT n=1 Tax=Roseibium denhamense TaxID=76305 RepID=A0ABY1PHJ2_9HYPH|nr:flagellar biosynthesis repressor FlbT [Roseibium denhamense]MTI06237.1 flagellar biosynthesis repressor FlbT [Roseibium denhamense]SMP32739.1 flagellar protein FlbT [Roseibium denhamense]